MTVIATYYIESRIDIAEAAGRLASEQSAGLADNDATWMRPEGLERARGMASVVAINQVEPRSGVSRLSLSHPDVAKWSPTIEAAEVQVQFRSLEQGFNVEELLNVVLGEPQNLGVLAACRLIDLTWDSRSSQSGPTYGVSGIRSMLQVESRPLCCAPIKPSTGLLLEEHIARACAAARGGADIVKDDELCHDISYNSLRERIPRMLASLAAVDSKKGEKTLYVANLIGSRASFDQRLQTAIEAGVEAIMVAPGLMGLDVVEYALNSSSKQLIIFSHSTLASALLRDPTFGMGLGVWAGLNRAFGADVVLLPTFGGSFGISRRDSSDAVAACLAPNSEWRTAFPAHSGSMSARTIATLSSLSREPDFIVTSGAGLFDHPEGPTRGAEDLRRAIDGTAVDFEWATNWVPDGV